MKDRIRLGVAGFLAAFASTSALPAAALQGPDVIVYDVGVNGPDTDDIHFWGTNVPGEIAAYSFGTQSCNSGDAELQWFTGLGEFRHPVISQNVFRLKDGRFEHIGQSWLKHGFCAVNEFEGDCGPCAGTDCSTLGVGCADTYWAMLNDGRGGRSKTEINAADGTHDHSGGPPTGGSIVRGRLQVLVADIDPAQNPGAEYFIEGHYIAGDDAAAGNAANNASWRRIQVNSVSNIVGGGATQREEPAIYAWRDQDPDVEIRDVTNTEGGFTTHFFLAYKVTREGSVWHYEYALHNLNSSQSAGSLSIPRHPTATISNIDFHGSRYHSGDPYDGTAWPGVDSGTAIGWATTDHSVNPDANALRWATLYNYRFDANTPPANGTVTIGLFEPGTNSSLTVDDVPVPSELVPKSTIAQAPGAPAGGPTVTVPLTTSRNGSAHNPLGLQEDAPALIGTSWRGSVELRGGSTSLVVVGLGGPSNGPMTGMGEVLIRPPFRILPAAAVSAGFGQHVLPIPANPDLVGTALHAQGAFLTEGGWRLTNALDITLGL